MDPMVKFYSVFIVIGLLVIFVSDQMQLRKIRKKTNTVIDQMSKNRKPSPDFTEV